jgi:Tol biopolymer transport system component
MRITAWASVAVVGLLVQAPVQQPDILLTVPQEDSFGFATSPPSASVSANGRYVALTSYARLVPADTNSRADIYVLDRVSGIITLESVTADGRALAGESRYPRLSGDGRCLVFQTSLSIGEDARSDTDIVLRDRMRDTATLVARDTPHGGPMLSRYPAISEDCRCVVFASAGTDLVAGRDENGSREDVYAFDVSTRALRRLSVNGSGVQSSVGASFAPSISGNGRYVTFTSTADLDARFVHESSSPPNLEPQVYVRDTELGTTTRVSTGPGLTRLDGASYDPSISQDGRYVAFVSQATNLARGDRNRSADVFLRDLQSQTTTVVSRRPDGGTANGPSGSPAISAEGRFIAFQSEASDLVCARRCPAALEDVNLLSDVFLYDRVADRMTWISVLASGGWAEESGGPAVDATGSIVTFTSRHPIDEQDVSNDFDLFVRVPANHQTTEDQSSPPWFSSFDVSKRRH